jgi:hypothetical protein
MQLMIVNRTDWEAVLEPLQRYVEAHATADPTHLREAFLPTAHIEGLRGNEFVSWDLETYCGLFSGEPAPTESRRRRTVDSLQVNGTIASATLTLDHDADVFTDMFILIRTPAGWRIANKVYHRRSRD